MSGQLEQPKDPDDAKELKYVRILDVGDEVLKDEVSVEAYCSHEVYHIHGRVEKIKSVWTAKKSRIKWKRKFFMKTIFYR